MTDARIVRYRAAGPVIKAFHLCGAFVRCLIGPIGSGKTTACVMEILLRANAQAAGPDGRRHSRWAVIRNTYGELLSTTVVSVRQWVGGYGKFSNGPPMTYNIRTADMDVEILFLALDREEDTRKVLSLELTAAWINEAREVPKAVLDALTGRVGRYPAKRDGGATWSGILMDTNPPDTESWLYRLAEMERPAGFEFFRQPSGLSADAENKANLPDGYYERVSAGKDEDWIRVYVHGEYGFVTEGRPVYPEYRDSVHTAAEPFPAVPGLPLLLGVDLGLTPALVIGQRLADGCWRILDEVTTDDCGLIRFSELISRYIAQNYPGFPAEGWMDPAGLARAQTDERTALSILKEYTPWRWHPAPDNSLSMRLEAVRNTLGRLIDGKPGLVLSPRCRMLRKGFAGGYSYRPVRSGNGAMYHDEPAKNAYSHPHDALQYLLSGGGEANVVLRKLRRQDWRNSAPRYALTDYDVFGDRGELPSRDRDGRPLVAKF